VILKHIAALVPLNAWTLSLDNWRADCEIRRLDRRSLLLSVKCSVADMCPDLLFSESRNNSIYPTDILVQSSGHMGICPRGIRCAESHWAIHFVHPISGCDVIGRKHLRFSRFQNPASRRPTGMVNQDGQPESSIRTVRTVNRDGQPGRSTRTANQDG